MMNNENLVLARILKNGYQDAIKSGNIAMAISRKQEFYNNGYHNLLSLDTESEGNNDNNNK